MPYVAEAIEWLRPHALDAVVVTLGFAAGWAASVSWYHWDDPS